MAGTPVAFPAHAGQNKGVATRDNLTRPRNWLAAMAILLAAIIEASLWIPGFYKELVAWQTAIAALFGFGGLITAAVFGFRNLIRAQEHQAELNRRRDDRLRAQEQFGLAITVRAEIRHITAQVGAMVPFLDARPSGGKDGGSPPSLEMAGWALEPASAPATERAIAHAGVLSPNATNFVIAWFHILEGLRRLATDWQDPAKSALINPEISAQCGRIVANLTESGDRVVEILSRDLTEIGTEHGWWVPPAVEEHAKLMEATIGPKPDAKDGEA